MRTARPGALRYGCSTISRVTVDARLARVRRDREVYPLHAHCEELLARRRELRFA